MVIGLQQYKNDYILKMLLEPFLLVNHSKVINLIISYFSSHTIVGLY